MNFEHLFREELKYLRPKFWAGGETASERVELLWEDAPDSTRAVLYNVVVCFLSSKSCSILQIFLLADAKKAKIYCTHKDLSTVRKERIERSELENMTNALFFIRRYALQMHLQTAYVRILTDISDHLEQLVTISCVRLSPSVYCRIF